MQGNSEERTRRIHYTVSERKSVIDTADRQEYEQYNWLCQLAGSYDTNAKIGVHGARETPVPIPNTEVKPCSGYNTADLSVGK